jgi:hypothetical protein
MEVGKEGVDVEFVRVEYDLEVAVRGIQESGLPDEFGDFLRTAGAAKPA